MILAELKNRPIKEVVAILTEATNEEIIRLTKEIAAAKQAENFGRVAAFLKTEKQNPVSLFIRACVNVSLEPTKRQASKWLMKKGLAYKQGRFKEVTK